MHTDTIALDETDCFGRFFLDYINGNKELSPFYEDFPSIENFKKVIEKRNFEDSKRKVLVETLSGQYNDLEVPELVKTNIESLHSKKTFTITTGHQLNIFTGPLYFIYKLVTAINTAKVLKQNYPEYHFVPVYWMASEDHDFEEINHFFLGPQKIEWNSDQEGAVGKFDPSGLKDISQRLPKNFQFFKEAYSKNTLADAVRCYVNHLFGKEGLVVIDADQPALKAQFKEVARRDILQNESSPFVEKSDQELISLSYKPQITSREINFFYLENDIRARIEKKEDRYELVDHDQSFSSVEIEKLIETNPERFSPNVTLRPLYQETILPNLAYIGGPAEMVYWLQLKAMFENYDVPFPILLPRNFALIYPESAQKKIQKLGLDQKEVFKSEFVLFSEWVKRNSSKNLSYQSEMEQIHQTLESAQAKAEAIDKTLLAHLDALSTQFENKLKKAEYKLLRAEKRTYTEKESQINRLKEELFPDGTLQERKENYITFALSNPNLLKDLLNTFDPFNFKMYLISE